MSRPVPFRRIAAGIGFAMLLVMASSGSIVASAGTPAASANAAYADAFAQARTDATSEFEQTVLADDMITPDEYADAAQQFADCMNAIPPNHLTVEPDPLIPGAFIYLGNLNPNIPPPVEDSMVQACASGITLLIEPLAIAIITNPSNEPVDDITLACLHALGTDQAAITATDLPALREDAEIATRRINPARISTTPDPAVVSCLANPGQTGVTATPEG